MRQHILAAAAGCIVFALVAGAGWGIAHGLHRELFESRHQRVREQMAGVQTGLRNALAARLQTLAETAAALGRREGSTGARFEGQLRELQAIVGGLRELREIHNGRVIHAFPPDRYSGRYPDATHADAAPAIATGDGSLAPAGSVLGPRELAAGGSGVIINHPIADAPGSAWLEAVLDFEALLTEAGVFDQFPDIEIALRGADALGAEGEVFYGHVGVFYSEALFAEIPLPNGSWELAVLPREGWGNAARLAGRVRAAGFALAALAALAVVLILHGCGRVAWLRPALFAVLTLTTFAALLWVADQRRQETARQELIRDTQRAQFTLRSLLRNHRDHMVVLARAAAAGELSPASFARRASSYRASHPEIETLQWLDPQRNTVAGTSDNAVLGSARDASAGAARLAFESRRATYSPPYAGVDGGHHFELWLPMFEEQTFDGWLAARYRLQLLLGKAVTANMRTRYQATLVDAGGTSLAVLDDDGRAFNPALSHQVALDPPGYNAALRLSRYAGERFDALLLGLGALSCVLAIGLFWATWRLQQAKLTLEHAVTQRTTSLADTNRELTQEIAERKRTEQALHGSRERFRRLVEGLTTSYVFSQDPQGVFTYVSPSVTQILGYTPGEFLTHYAQSYSRHRDNQAAIGHAEASLRGEARPPYEVRRRHKDGREVVLEVSEKPVFDETGAVAAVEGIATDISARKRAESELARYHDRLQELVRQRTASLELLNRELESFSYSVSHDLRAPLRAIDGFSKALAEDCGERLDAGAREHLARIRTASQRMSKLIDALLKLSRLTRQKMNPQIVEISTLVREVAEVLRDEAPERDVELVLQEQVVAYADPELLRVALANLIGNAWKFTANEPRAVIEFGVTETEHGKTYFVRDNGAGFDAAQADEIFTSFKRLHSEAEFSGSGIGLATVARIIRRHNGKVWAQGEPGAGATLFFTLDTLADAPAPGTLDTSAVRQSRVSTA